MKKNDRYIDLEDNSEWTFDCKTRGPDLVPAGADKPVVTWTCVLSNAKGERRFVTEKKMLEVFKRREA